MTLPNILPLIGLEGITLLTGSHSQREQGVCLLEAAAWLAGEKHSDSPTCVCPVLAAFGRRLNDRISDDETRTKLLRPIVPLLLNTKASREVELKRAYLVTDWAVRVITPQWLDLRDNLKVHATALRALPPLNSADAYKSALGTIRAARTAAYAAAAYAAAAYAYAADAAAYAAAADAAAYAAADAAADAAAYAYAAADDAAKCITLRDAQLVDAARILRKMIAIS